MWPQSVRVGSSMGSLQMPQVVLLDPFSDASAAVAVAAEALASESGPCSMSIWSGMTPPEQACRRGTIEAMILIVIFISSFGSDRSFEILRLGFGLELLVLGALRRREGERRGRRRLGWQLEQGLPRGLVLLAHGVANHDAPEDGEERRERPHGTHGLGLADARQNLLGERSGV